MKVSVIIPTLNAGKYLEKLLLSLSNQTYKNIEIIIIDSSSVDDTIEIAKAYNTNIIRIPRRDFDHGGTRNKAVDQSTGDIVAFLTQDACPMSNDYIQKLVDPLLNDPLIAASFGQQVAKEDSNELEKFFRLYNYPTKSFIKGKDDITRLGLKTFFFSNVCSAIRKREFYEVGKFPEHVILNEDMIIAAKIILNGYRIAYTSEAKVWHSHNYSLKQQFKRYFDIGASLSMNNWILNYATAEKEGARLLINQTKYFINKGLYGLIFKCLVENIVKYTGYKLGKIEKFLPINLKKKLSMHSYFWDQYS